MLYVYAMIRLPFQPPPGLLGLQDRPLEACACGTVAAVYTQHAAGTASVAATADNLWRHELVVESLMQDHALLPARFGTVLADEQKVSAALTAHHEGLCAGMERVRGCVELGVRALWRPPGAGPGAGHVKTDATGHAAGSGAPPQERHSASGTGRAYMLARLAAESGRRRAQEHAQGLADALHAPLAACAREAVRRVLSTPDLLLTGAYLVQRPGVEAFERRVRQVATDHPDLRLLCTGPWPPYHFTPAAVAAGATAGLVGVGGIE